MGKYVWREKGDIHVFYFFFLVAWGTISGYSGGLLLYYIMTCASYLIPKVFSRSGGFVIGLLILMYQREKGGSAVMM